MKNLFSPLFSLVATVACALTLGSCNRAEYAMLPQSSSYLGAQRSVAVAPAKVATDAATATPAAAESVAPVAAPATAETKSVAAQPQAIAPAASTTSTVAAAPAAALPAAAVAAAQADAPAKMSRVQKFATGKVMRTLAKTAGVTQFKEKLAVAKTQKVSGNLRMGIILILIGLLISLFSFLGRIFGIIGGIVAIIGLIFIILWLLDNV